MVLLKPKNFNRLPLGYRPRKTVKVNKNFANKVRRVNRNGARADDEDIADVLTVVENMKTYTPNLFRGNKRSKKFTKKIRKNRK